MNKQRRLIIIGSTITLFLLGGYLTNHWLLPTIAYLFETGKQPTNQSVDNNNTVSLHQLLGTLQTSPFQQAIKPIIFNFPEDHGPHFSFRSEWWYFTGHLFDANRQHYGFQFTLFRFASRPTTAASNPWLIPQFYMAHLALSNTQQQTHRSAAKFSRQGPGLAGIKSTPLNAWLETWQLQSINPASLLPAKLIAHAPEQQIGLQLTLNKEKTLVLQGNQGLSQKSNMPGNASYYYSYPRLTVSGTIHWNQQQLPVTGQAWFDHEWGTSALEYFQTGWDWFSLQLENQQELMIYRIRSQPGHPETLFASLNQANQQLIPLNSNQINIKTTQYWQAPNGTSWPSQWQLNVPEHQLSLTLTPTQPNQLMPYLFTYWEGAVKITGSHQGWGFVELTGY
ncbi:lipocalin-like domain-containing protein [Spartinivicinus ruber]|uniref:lipocalin-like domain-containing protein n=1 Tax=Spartinivicinus ruber TaxID=2683272 RepID=UPI0013D44320|nr:lipocalin-like domain-containing protein [Spartinivicinus ruber]